MEKIHQRTFCPVCQKGRLVFIGEQKYYHLKKLDDHYYYGDPGGETGIEILPHPFCEFCDFYMFNDQQLNQHMNKNHFTCHICGEKYKNFYYKDYKSLEIHFDKTHFLCQEDMCKASNYIVFRTPEELTLHTRTIHW